MPMYEFERRRPVVASSAYVAPTAIVVGQVTIGERCYVGHGAILRGDYGAIEIGEETAIEEGVILHARPADRTRIGRRVTVGHGAMIHNATIHDGAVIGMRAVVSDYAEVGEGAIVGEMTLVPNGGSVPPGKIALGVPARVRGDVDERHEPMTRWAKELYVALAGRYAAGALVELADPEGAEPPLPRLRSIGTIRTPFAEPADAPVQGGWARDARGQVHLDPALAPALADLDGFSHVVLLFAFHRSQGWSPIVEPYLDDTPRGLFATRAPRRPNPLGMTVVRLLGVADHVLEVQGVDMLDGTPLLDIKPFVPRFDAPARARCGWLEKALRRRNARGTRPRADGRFHRPRSRRDKP